MSSNMHEGGAAGPPSLQGGGPAVPGVPQPDDPLSQLRAQLQRLRRFTGEPSLREVSRRIGPGVLSHVTVGVVLRCERTPAWGNLELVVEALGGNPEEFRPLWIAARQAQDTAPVAVEPPGGAGVTDPVSVTVDPGSPVPPRPGAAGRATPVQREDVTSQGPGFQWRSHREAIGAALAAALLMLIVLIVHQVTGTGAVSSCQGIPVSGPLSAVVSENGNCYGFTDTADAETGFGHDPMTTAMQSVLFKQNRPHHSGDLTVIWFGALTCTAYRPDGTCSDGRAFRSELQELQGLALAQRRTDLGGQIHVVIANAGSDMSHAVEVAHLIAGHRASFGRVVATGGGESRTDTREAIRILLAAEIPFIAPTLTGDLQDPGHAFLNLPNYLQFSPPNQAWAISAISLIATHTPQGARRQVFVYHAPDPGDEYTESLALDVLAAARSNPVTGQAPQIVSDVSQLPASVCGNTSSTSRTPAAVFFADRSATFGTFANHLSILCGSAGPALLVGSPSVSDFLSNDAARTSVDAPWPMAYYRKGTQCAELQASAATSKEAALLLAAASTVFGACATDQNGYLQIGSAVADIWDAVTLASEITPINTNTNIVKDAHLLGSAGPITVQSGQITASPVTPEPLCVLSVDLPARSASTCDKAFGTPGRGST
jgi:hypothetical protein